MKITKNILAAYQHKQPFVMYRKPKADTVSIFIQKNDTLFFTESYAESGFVFAPFDDREVSILMPKKECDYYEECVVVSNQQKSQQIDDDNYTLDDEHISLVQKGIEAIHKNEFEKVVLSRQVTVSLKDFSFIETYKKLLFNYADAFVYVWYHPKVGLWLGATPETLLKSVDNNFETMSLAGTQVFKGDANVVWQQKEIDEQKFVTDYITHKLAKTCDFVEKEPTKTIKAGSLLHLQTKIKGRIKTEKYSELIKTLHPTPAVCGLPKEVSKEFIINNENYKREFYTGFLGELAINQKNDLYVNLRCMQIKDSRALIYVGGGITKDSNPIKEFEETLAKSKTMRTVLS